MATPVDQALERRIRAALNAAVDLDGLSVTVHVENDDLDDRMVVEP